MPEFFFDYQIGGVARVKVTAPTKDRALEIVEDYAIEDFENAGPLRAGDVRIEELSPLYQNPEETINASIRDAAGAWAYAPDDPAGRGDDE